MKGSRYLLFLLFLPLLAASCAPADSGTPNGVTTDGQPTVTATAEVETSAETVTEDTAPTLKQTDLIVNPELWATPTLPGGEFMLTMEISDYTSFQHDILRESIKAYNVGTTDSVYGEHKYLAGEWANCLLNRPTGTDIGSSKPINNVFLDGDPQTREEAVKLVKEFIVGQFVEGVEHPWASMNGHYVWQHYAAEAGFDIIGSEIGENVYNYQFHYAMSRGAARQYGTAWFIDFSSWHGPGILDYTEQKIWRDYSSPDNGHSLSLMERSFVSAYMSGADGVVAEAGAYIGFYDTIDPETGLYKISPYGETCRAFNEFSQANPDVGITYTPVVIILDYYNGMGHPTVKKAFGRFDYTPGDFMTYDLVELLWGKDAWVVEANADETGALVSNAYGDSFDVLLQNASPEVLATYPALLLSGDITLSPKEAETYRTYVKNGGTLILNTAYLKYFPAYEGTLTDNRYTVTDGAGRVIVYGPDYSVEALDGILSEVIDELVPFSYSEDVQSILNVADGCYYLTLINNDGVTKRHHVPFKLKKAIVNHYKKELTVQYMGGHEISSVSDIYGGHDVKLTDQSFEIQLMPGEIAILKIEVK